MTDLYPHLFPAYREQAENSDEARIDWLRRDRWIALPQAEAALGRLEDLLTYPPRGRMPCLLLLAPRAWAGALRIHLKVLRQLDQSRCAQ